MSRDILSKYVTNPDGDVYCIQNLPEEVIAVIFAYVSRSPLSFKENLIKLISDDELGLADSGVIQALEVATEKAKKFHEKWVVGYGHSSVAELAVAHVGIEKISRLASSELELSNPFLSFVEYSQRYQKPQRGDYYIPKVLKPPHDDKFLSGLYDSYKEFMNEAYDAYEKLFNGLMGYLSKVIERHQDESDKRYMSRIEKIAFEDARYALPLATFTNLGMTGNGRAIRDSLVYMLSSPYGEVNDLALDIKAEVSKVLPTLLRYTNPSDYLIRMNEFAIGNQFEVMKWLDVHDETMVGHNIDEDVILLRSTYDPSDRLLVSNIFRSTMSSYADAEYLSGFVDENDLNAFIENLTSMGKFDSPISDFRQIKYFWELKISEANWHQLLRHVRSMKFVYQEPSVFQGYTVPPNVRDAGLSDILDEIVSRSSVVFKKLASDCPEIAPYVVLNAHKRRVLVDSDLWSLYHFINLRTTEEAQWDIRNTAQAMYDIMMERDPKLVANCKRR